MTLTLPLRLLIATALAALTSLPTTAQTSEHSFIDKNMAFAARQYHRLAAVPPEGRAVMPHSLDAKRNLVRVPVRAWSATRVVYDWPQVNHLEGALEWAA